MPIAIIAQSDHRAFHQHVRCSLSEAIDRQRVEHAKVLVRETRSNPHESGFIGGVFR